MSALAEICLDKGYKVSGSDINDSHLLENLRNKGAIINIPQEKKNITDDIDIVVYTAAVDEDNSEMAMAIKKKKFIISRAVFLGQIMREYKNSIAVSGTHGKTTTTSMLSAIYEYANFDPTILVGGNLNFIGGNVKIGKSEHFIAEACEYKDSFLSFNPTVGIILNIEPDHLDYFSGIDEIKASFNKFAKRIRNNGYLIINGDDKSSKEVTYDVKANIIKYGINSDNDAVISNIKYDEVNNATFDLKYKNEDLKTFTLSVPGKHNIYNATAAIMASYVNNIDIEIIRKNLKEYKGVGRRFEIKGKYNNALVIDDYAHHPSEVMATLKAVDHMKKNKVYVAFQPHTYTRTKFLLNDFAKAFDNVDDVVIADIFAAREDDPGDICSQDLVDKLNESGVNAQYIKEFSDITDYFKRNVKDNDLVFTLGAGPIYKVADELVKKDEN